MVTIEIDGQKCEIESGSMIIAAADKAGIHIPRFCYHKKLSVAANCRMCLVEVQKAPKALPACATPVAEGMVVFTQSERARLAQKDVMEFLLINHPLDCPICDQGGECELQDNALMHGRDHSHFNFGKRTVEDKNLGPLIATEMTRCIHCTRCVRFGTEIAGMREMGATGRGEDMKIGTYLEKNIDSELSGNIIDLCPVGALTSKPFRFSARAWELQQSKGIAPHDCVGSHLFWHTQGQKVKRVVPREEEAINETWLSDRDRFGYLGLNHEARLETPLIKRQGKWVEISWEEALTEGCRQIAQVVKQHGAEQLGALIHPSSTVEEAYLLQRLVRGLGSHNIDHRLRLQDSSYPESLPLAPSLGCTLPEIEKSDVILLIGSDVRKEAPLLSHRIRKAVNKGGQVFLLNSKIFEQIFTAETILSSAGALVQTLALLLKTTAEKMHFKEAEIVQVLAGIQKPVSLDPSLQIAATAIAEAKSIRVLLGPLAQSHPDYMQLRSLAKTLARSVHGTFGEITEGANQAGCWIAGAVPHRGPRGRVSLHRGLSCPEMVHTKQKAMLLVNIDPLLDMTQGVAFTEQLKGATSVIAFTAFKSEALLQHATLLLPIALVPETSGTYVNACLDWQSFRGAIAAPGTARPLWKVLRVMGNQLDLEGFDYTSSEDVLSELKSLAAVELKEIPYVLTALAPVRPGLIRLAPTAMYGVDPTVRHAVALQETTVAQNADIISLHPNTAKALKLEHASRIKIHQRSYPLRLDPSLAEGTLLAEAGTMKTSALPAPYAIIETAAVSEG